MRAVDLIEKKRNKEELSKEEISFLLNEYLKGNVPDYQMSSFLMATYFNDMTASELQHLEWELQNFREKDWDIQEEQ